MGRIRVLPDIVASQVAAGEVVERPAAVVKELLENSLDAGAKSVTVEVSAGGTRLIRVSDDGGGMDREDALMALERHATSKIFSIDDLTAVSTLGFRGEALPSIASVSEFHMRTKRVGELVGTEIFVEGGKNVSVRDCGDVCGTIVEVGSLFFNVPARRKFLRGLATESGHIDRVVNAVAIGRPDIRLKYVRDGRIVLNLAAGNLKSRVADIFGGTLGGMSEVDVHGEGGISVFGLVSSPEDMRTNRERQFFFINGRWVDSFFLNGGIREAYRPFSRERVFPSAFLFLSMPAEEVDCNVHPAKRDVRFKNGFGVRDAVRGGVEKALRKENQRKFEPVGRHIQGVLDSLGRDSQVPPTGMAGVTQLPLVVSSVDLEGKAGLGRDCPVKTGESDTVVPKILGSTGRYILLDGPEGVTFLDVGNARRRIAYDRAVELQGKSQALLSAIVLELDPDVFDAVSGNLERFRQMGFDLEPFGGLSIRVEAVPAFFRTPSVKEEFLKLAQIMADGGTDILAQYFRTDDAGAERLSLAEQAAVVREIFSCENPYATPDGKTIMWLASFRELDRKFGRG